MCAKVVLYKNDTGVLTFEKISQLQKEKMENEKLKMDYEVRMQAYEEAVKSQVCNMYYEMHM